MWHRHCTVKVKLSKRKENGVTEVRLGCHTQRKILLSAKKKKKKSVVQVHAHTLPLVQLLPFRGQ